MCSILFCVCFDIFKNQRKLQFPLDDKKKQNRNKNGKYLKVTRKPTENFCGKLSVFNFFCVRKKRLKRVEKGKLCNSLIPNGFTPFVVAPKGSSIDDFPLKLWRPRPFPVEWFFTATKFSVKEIASLFSPEPLNKLLDELRRFLAKSGLFKSANDSERPIPIKDSIEVSKRIICRKQFKVLEKHFQIFPSKSNIKKANSK